VSDAARSLVVVHEDNHLLVIDKPAGLATVPDSSGDESALDLGKAWIRERHAKPGAVFLGVVHRLDRPVSGLVVFARTSKAASRLAGAMKGAAFAKTYLGVVEGGSFEDAGEVRHHLVKDERANRVRWHARATTGSKEAWTRYRVLERRGERALLLLEPVTGRSHQLRAACASLGGPLLGDLKYGAREPLRDASIALHAARLAFPHPTRDETVDLVAAPAREPFHAFRGVAMAALGR
jgi:23S rRNA pseudouridine1911/1915/1917 synthase